MRKVPGDGGRDNAPANEDRPEPTGEHPAAPRFVYDLVAALMGMGVPRPTSRAFRVLVGEIRRQPNTPDGDFIPGEFFFDDPDGQRARVALDFARRRQEERAALTGDPHAVAVSRLLRLALAAESDGGLAKALAALGAKAEEHMRKAAAPRRAAVLAGIEADASRQSVAGWLGDLSPAELRGATQRAVDEVVSQLRVRFALRDEYWDSAELTRLVYERALDSIKPWQPRSSSYPSVSASAGGEGIARALHGALSRGLPHLTHRGRSLEERQRHADRAVDCIARELDDVRGELLDDLTAARLSDDVNASQGEPRTRYPAACARAALRITNRALMGLYVANGADRRGARQAAEDKVDSVRKGKRKEEP